MSTSAEESTEVPKIIYVESNGIGSNGVADALRHVADRLDADDDLVLVGLWNVDPGEPWQIRLQVVLTHMED